MAATNGRWSVTRTLATGSIIAALGAMTCLGDTWAPPVERDYVSSNKRFIAHVTPVTGTAKAFLQVCEVQEGRQVALWSSTLGNEGAPQEVFLTDDGMHAVGVNEWSTRVHGGWGDHVLAFYNEKGNIRHYSLEQLLGYPERISQKEFDYLVSRTTAGRYWASIKFLRQVEGRWLFFAWLDHGRRWLAWDSVTGGEVAVTSSLSSSFDEIARQWAVQDVLKTGQPVSSTWPSAIGILLRLKRPEDRKFIEPLLHAQDFRTGRKADDRAFERYYAYSSQRNSAEKTLAQWDSALPGNGGGVILDEYRYLGVVRGKIVLPRAPTPADTSWLCVYLIPESSKREDWYSEVPVYRLSVHFGKYHLPPRYVWPGASIPFIVCGISPGRYYLKTVWDTSSPYTFQDNSISGPPSPGDYENQQAPLIAVTAGSVIEGVTADCTQEVAQRSTTVWSAVVMQRVRADEPPCPCGKEHGGNRVCVVFNKPLPLERFDWGPYHNNVPTDVTREGTTTTYMYVFEKMAPDPNRSGNRDFDMHIRMVARVGELAYVTVEGPYFWAVPLQSFLRALMVQGLDVRNLEGQGRVYGGPIRSISSQASLNQVVQVFGEPSETTADEVTFSYSLKGPPDNARTCWVKYKVTKEGLLLEGRTNLAGGISFFSFGR